MNNGMDLDPLSTYEYPSYNSYHPPFHPQTIQHLPPYLYQNVKQEDTLYNKPHQNNTGYINNTPETLPQNPPIPQDHKLELPNPESEVKPDITKKKKDKKNGKNFCSEKINDATYPFYGCSVCNISYTSLQELDQHVIIHKNRMTSYRLRLRNQLKKKQIKKEKKKLKKMKKIKQEIDFEFEIKPEDGYIGNEKAADFVNDENVINTEPLNKNIETNNDDSNINNENGININTNQVIGADDPNSINTIFNNDNGSCVNTENKDTEASDSNSIATNIETDNKDTRAISVNTNNKTNSSDVKDNNSQEDNSKDIEEAELNNLEKIYKCFACKKQFTLSYYLKLHVRSHTDEKPYTCTVCGQSFITASKLGRHNKRIHLAARFQCRICFKIFSRFELLTSHFDKSHPEDKLEGEPYDYNEILPYLKELEEQFKEEAEAKEKKKDDLWLDIDLPAEAGGVKQEDQEMEEKLIPKIDIIVEELKVDTFDEVKVKQEVGDESEIIPENNDVAGDDFQNDDDNDVKNEDFKNDSLSDDDYFPSNTWAATPKCDLSPPPSPKRKKTSSFKTRTCEVCNKEISSASYMRVHMRTHTGEKPFKCYKCGRGFITSSKMNRHVLTHGTDAKVEDIKQEDTEVKKEDEAPTEDETTNSTKKKRRKRKLSKGSAKGVEKVRKKHQKRPHSCEYCNQKFLHLNMLEVHKKCHEGEELVFKCHYCLEEALDGTALKEHEATHSGPKPYLCTICGKTYKKREAMVYHRKHHQPEKEYICDVCSKRFNAACKLAKHLATHRADQFVLRYECPVCAHMFNTKYHVQMHLATHQKEGLIMESNRNEVLAMVLQNALKIPKQPDAASSLTDIISTDERYRICKICGETFHHFYYLEEHLKSHGSKIAIDDTNKSEEKKYICEICNKGFKLHYYLKLHSFTHSKEKPFICQQCGKGFITKGKLKRHLETHTGLKKYQCHICYKFFTRPSYLRIHIRTIHGGHDYHYGVEKTLSMFALSEYARGRDGQESV